MKKKKIAIIAFIALFSLTLTGCKVAKLENGQDAAVTLNEGLGISANDLYDTMKTKYGAIVLLDLMDSKILNKDYPKNDNETKFVDTQISSLIQSFGSEKELLQQAQTTFGISTMDELKEYYALIYKRRAATKDYVIGQITDKEVTDYYNNRVFGDTKASHILIKPVAGKTEEENQKNEKEALSKAKELIRQLNEGADFAKLAKEHSEDTGSAKEGGSLGEFSYGTMVETFELALMKLDNGKYTLEPVKSSFGYHIIKKESSKEKPKIDGIKDNIKEKIYSAKASTDTSLEITAMEKLREKYGMKIEDTNLKNAYDLYVRNLKEANKAQ